MLVDPDFLLRVYHEPADVKAATVPAQRHRAGVAAVVLPVEQHPGRSAHRSGRARRAVEAAGARAQVRRMLADPKAVDALVHDFAAQWLNLRRLSEVVVHPDFYPNFDESLLNGFREETELFVGSTLREDRSVLDLLRADYTFVNERVARHYGIPGVYGSRFRRVTLPEPGPARRPARARIDSGDRRRIRSGRRRCCAANTCSTTFSACRCRRRRPAWTRRCPMPSRARHRRRFASGSPQHRNNAVCSSCHSAIDPPGFALEQFDAIGGWRTARRGGTARRRGRDDGQRQDARRPVGPARVSAREAGSFSADGDREAAGVRARPAARVLRSSGRAADRSRRRRERLPLVVACPGNRKEPRVSDARGAGDDHEFRDDEIAAASDGPARPRRDARAAVSRRDGAGVRAGRARGGEAGPPLPDLLCPERDGDGVLDAEGRRRRRSSCRRSSSRWRRSATRCWCSAD